MKGRVALAALVVTASVAPTARADERLADRKVPRRAATLERQRGWVVMSARYRDAVPPKIRKKLLSGLPTTISTRVYIFREGTSSPVALSVQTCKVVYDLWDEVFRVESRRRGAKRRTVAVNVEGVVRLCGQIVRMPVAPLVRLAPRAKHFAGVLVEVNPLSKATLDRIRRWVALPRGAGDVGPGDALFGSFVGLFVTRVPAADQTVKFRSVPFVASRLPKVKRRPQPSPRRRRPRN